MNLVNILFCPFVFSLLTYRWNTFFSNFHKTLLFLRAVASYLKDAWTRKLDRPSFTRIYNSHWTIVTNILKNEPNIVRNKFKQNSTKIRNDTSISSFFVFSIHCRRKLFNATDEEQMRIKHKIAEYPCYCCRFSNCIAIIRLKRTNRVHIFFVFYISLHFIFLASLQTAMITSKHAKYLKRTHF